MIMFSSTLPRSVEAANVLSQRWLVLVSEHSFAKLGKTFDQSIASDKLHVLLDNPHAMLPPMGAASIGSLQDLEAFDETCWAGVVFDADLPLTPTQTRILMNYRLRGLSVYPLAEFYEAFWSKLPSKLLNDNWFTLSFGLRLRDRNLHWWFKRISDVIASSSLALVLLPVMLLAAIAVRLNSPGPILYSQVRSGQDGRPFRVYKFRSMYQDAEKRGAQWAQEHDPRITPVGHLLRISRVDELPQLWNVIRGDMSLIGPRPERPEFDAKLAQAIPYYDLRYCIKPGITGWAQVMYPYGASIEDAYEKLAYDLYYIKNYSIALELWIALKTILVVVLGKGR